jgi:hypothetical protein
VAAAVAVAATVAVTVAIASVATKLLPGSGLSP